ncbi:major facilitator superfamily domain-containing protein [Bisporella sp. PMI_857]|nr:major facilitator superfamily domain-containing protein [Bisporella sp. PMI_857]
MVSQDLEKSGSDGNTHTPDAEPDREESLQSPNGNGVSKEAQAGVQAMEATTSVWTKSHLIAAYVMIWFIYFIASMEEVVLRALNPYVTSAFSRHSLTAATTIMSSIIGGLSKIPLAKILDTWGRPQGLALTLFIWVIGYIMMAGCDGVETYAAAQVFCSVGSQGVSYCMTVFIADTSSLKNRSLMLAYATTPYIITSWIGGPVSNSIVQGPGWRWGFGIFSIVVPVVVSPLCALFFWNNRKAKNAGLLPEKRRNFSLATLKDYAIEVDLIGIIILAAGMALFLLPFGIWSYQKEQWRSAMIICMIIFGGLLLIAFAVYEKYLAPVTFIPFELLTDRTVLFGAIYFLFVFFAGAIWGSYFFSMLQVVYKLNITEASYVSAIYRVGSCFWALAVGMLIRWTGRFKWLALSFGVPLQMLGVALMIYFRTPGTDIGYIIMTQIFVAFAGGTIVICGEMAMMAPSDHQHIAVIIAILNLFCSIGSAVGSTVSAFIWTSRFSAALKQHLPAGAPYEKIYGSIISQMFYRPGTPTRNAIDRSYGDAQRYMLITSVCLLVGALVSAVLWRDIKVKSVKQVRGRVV